MYDKCSFFSKSIIRHYRNAPFEKAIEVYRNENGRFELDATYAIYPDWALERMTDKERAAIVNDIPVVLRADDEGFCVDVRDVFKGIDNFG